MIRSVFRYRELGDRAGIVLCDEQRIDDIEDTVLIDVAPIGVVGNQVENCNRFIDQIVSILVTLEMERIVTQDKDDLAHVLFLGDKLAELLYWRLILVIVINELTVIEDTWRSQIGPV